MTSACEIIATIKTPRAVAITSTLPPAKIAPPITGAAKEGKSHESPMLGVHNCSLQTTSMPAIAANRPEITCAVTTTLEDEIPINSAECTLFPYASMCRPVSVLFIKTHMRNVIISGIIMR